MKKYIFMYVLRILKGHVHFLFLLLLLGGLDVAFSLSVIEWTKQLIDVATGVRSGKLVEMIVFLGGLFFISIVIRNIYSWLTVRMQFSLRNGLVRSYFSTILNVTWTDIQPFHSGNIMSRMDRDMEDLTRLWVSTVPQFVITALKLGGALAFLYWMEPCLALVLTGLVPVVILLSKLYFKRMHSLSLEIKSTLSSIREYCQEIIQNLEIVKAFSMNQASEKKLIGRQNQYVKVANQLNYFSIFSHFVLSIGFTTGYLITFSWGLFRLEAGIITFGTMMAFLQLVNMIQGPALGLVGLMPEFITSYTAAERLMEIDGLKREEEKVQHWLPDLRLIEFSDVSFSYQPEVLLLNKLNMYFEKGHLYALVGATGCGKTTIARLLLAFIRPTSGEIWLSDGKNKMLVSENTRINFSYVPQDYHLFSGTIRDNFRMVKPEVTDEEIYALLDEVSASFVKAMPDGLDTVLKEQGKGLSGGQIQRLAIARALLSPGTVLLLDEITSSLDEETELDIITSLRKIAEKRLILLVSHKQKVIAACDVIYRLG